MLFDIHSHILPEIDDGAENLNESLKILKLMQEQGITDVMATPHFYPAVNNLEDFSEAVALSIKKVEEFAIKRNLPRIYLGCELLYFDGISNVESLSQFCLNNSRYLLLELTDDCINDFFFEEILKIRNRFDIMPIIAHVERYCLARKYKKLIKFLIEHKLPVQINASSVLLPQYNRVIKKLLNSTLTCYIASDAHSTDFRPPQLGSALEHIAKTYGEQCCAKLLKNSEQLFSEITAV